MREGRACPAKMPCARHGLAVDLLPTEVSWAPLSFIQSFRTPPTSRKIWGLFPLMPGASSVHFMLAHFPPGFCVALLLIFLVAIEQIQTVLTWVGEWGSRVVFAPQWVKSEQKWPFIACEAEATSWVARSCVSLCELEVGHADLTALCLRGHIIWPLWAFILLTFSITKWVRKESLEPDRSGSNSDSCIS